MLKQLYQFCLRQIAISERDLFRASRRAGVDVSGEQSITAGVARVFAYLTAGIKFIFFQFLLVFIELAILIALPPKEGYELLIHSHQDAEILRSAQDDGFYYRHPEEVSDEGSRRFFGRRLYRNDKIHNYESYEKRHKKARWVSLASFGAAVAAVVAVSLVVNLILPLAPSVLGATYTFNQTNWGGGATANNAIHPTNQSAWSQYASRSSDISVINGGEDLEIASTTASTTQTTNTDFNAGTYATTTVVGSGSSASVKLTKAAHINEYTIGTANGSTAYSVSVTASSVTPNSNGTWTIAFSGTPNLARIFKNDKFTDSGSLLWKVLSVAPDVYKIIVVDSEGMTPTDSAPRTGSGTVGRWYASISLWETARQGDIIAGGRNSIERGLPYYDGAPDTTTVTIDGWSTDATHYIEIYVPLSERHRGKWDTGKYRLDATISSGLYALYNRENNVRIDGLQIQWQGSSANVGGVVADLTTDLGSADVRISNTIFKANVSGAGKDQNIGFELWTNTSSHIAKLWNNIFYNINGGATSEVAIWLSDSSGTIYAYNNTIYNNTKGLLRGGGNFIAKNNIVVGSGNTNAYVGTFAAGTDYNATDGTDNIGTGSNNKTLQIFYFTDPSGGDFHLDFNDTAAKNAGTDLSADANLPITTDIDGDTRSGTWDIGADDVGATLVMPHSIGTASRDFSTLQAWEDARDGNLTTRQVFRATQQAAFTEGETVTGQSSGATGAYAKEEATPKSSLKGTYNTSGLAENVYVSGNYAYVADWTSGLQIINISNPANPTLTGTYNTPGLANDVYVSGNYAYVADYTTSTSTQSSLEIINISNPSSPTLTGSYNLTSAEDIYVSGNYAYVGDGASGLEIIDISNPASPTLAGTYNTTGSATGVYVSGNYAYVGDGSSGLQIINISSSTAPTLAGTYNTTGSATGVYVSGNYAYVGDGASGLQIINISSSTAPTLAGTYNTPGTAYYVHVSGNYAYVGDGSGLQIINISSSTAPTLSGTYNTPNYPTDIAYSAFISGGYAYVTDDSSGLQIIKPLEYFSLDGVTGTFQVGETLVGATSGATSTIGAILTTAGVIEKGEAYKDSTFTAGVTIDGSTTDASHYMWLTAEPGSRHTGVWDTNKVTISLTSGSGDAIAISDSYTIVDGFQVSPGGAGSDSGIGINDTPVLTGIIASNNIIKTTSGTASGIHTGSAVGATIYNNIIQGNVQYGIWDQESQSSGYTDYIYNNTLLGTYSTGGIVTGATYLTAIAKNNIVASCSSNCYIGTFDTSSSNNISSDATAPGTGSLTNIATSSVRFVSTASDFIDLHILDGSVAKDAGADLSATFNTDTDGQTRGAAFDAGADEWFSSSPVYNTSGTFTSGTIDFGGAVKFTTANFTRTMTSGGIGKAFGANALGQLGDGTTATTSNAVNISGLTNLVAVEGNNGWEAKHFSLGLLADGTVKAWGDNFNGQLGNNTTTNSITPVSVSGITNAIAIAAGSSNSYALLADGTVKGWGYNNYGQVGDGSATQRLTPVTVCATGASAGTCDANPLTNVVAIASGEQFALALLADGTVKAWGLGYNGAIGDGTTNSRATPTLVPGIANAVAIGAGDRFVGAVLSDGTVKAWGLNDHGQLGINTTSGPDNCGGTACSRTPVLVCATSSTPGVCDTYLSNVVSLAGGDDYFHALLADGTVKAWGNGASSGLGDGASTQRLLPVTVCNTGASAGQCDANPLTNVVAIASGDFYSLALLSNGTVKSWGSGSYGVLGNSTPYPYTSTLTPVTVCATGASAGTCDANPLTNVTAIGAGLSHSLIVIGGARFSAAAKTVDSGWQDSDYKPLGNQIGMSPTKAVFPTSFSGNRYLRYKAYLSTADSAFSPQLDDVTVNYTHYATNTPTLTSSPYNTNDATNILGKIAWTATTTSGNEVRIQVRSAPNSGGVPGTWSQWCGYTACDDVDYFATSTNGVSLASGHPLKNGNNDQWLQYKVILVSNGAGTPTFSGITLTYVVNAPPVLQNVTASQQTSDGKVAISYQVMDTDTSTGTVTPNAITPSFSYSTDGGNNWTAITSGYLGAGALTNKTVNIVAFTQYSTTWDAKSQINGTYATNTKIMVTANDNEGANNTASLASSVFTLDVKNPVATVVVDGTKDGQAGAITTNITDNSSAQMMLSNLSNYSADGLNGSSGTWIATSTSLTWNFAAGDLVRVYGKVRDAYQNETAVLPDAPNTPANVTIQDTSNLNLSEFREFISWNVSTSSDFGSYKVYRSTDGVSYSLLSTITSAATNYLEDGSSGAWLSNGTTYYYKVVALDTTGSVSRYSSIVSDIPDGQGGTDVTPPTISGLASSNLLPTQATITWTTDELSNSAVYYSINSSYSSSKAVTSMVTAHSVTLTGLTPGTTYNFRARSTDPLGNISSYATGTPFATAQGPVISGVVVVSASGNSAEIVWNTNANSDSWVIFSLNSDLSGSQTTGTSTPVGGSGPNYEHRVALSGLNTNAKYYFKVRSVDGSSNAAEDNNGGAYYTFSTAQDVSPPIISNVAAALASQTSAVISWTTNELSDSQVIYGLDQSSLISQTAVNSTMTINHSMVLSGLTAGAKYYYKVVSADSSANSTQSSVYNFDTTALALQDTLVVTRFVESQSQPADKTPPLISDVSFSDIGETAAAIAWGTDENSGSFVEFGATEQLGATVGQFESVKIHRVDLKWLSPNTLYYIRAKSPDESGNLGASKIVSFKTLPAKTAADQAKELAQNIAKNGNNQKSIEELTKEVEQMLADLATKVAPPKITGAEPQVEITSSFATITWATDRSANSMVAFAGEKDYLPNSDDPYQISVGNADEQVTEHKVILSDLAPGTLYHFQARSKGVVGGVGASKDFTFRTGEEASISGVEIKEIKKDSATILWRTNIPASSLLEYGLSTVYESKQSDDAFNLSHIAILRNLNSGTFYHFKIGGTDKNSNAVASPDLTFTTESLPSLLNVKIDAVKEKEIKISWYTDVLADSTAEYTNLKTSKTESFGDKQLVRNHALAVTGLDEDAPYKLNVISKDDKGNEVKSSTYNFQTTRDREAPQITNIQTQSAVSGKDRVQTIVSWKTSEPASSRVIYQEGVVKKPELEKTSPLDNDLKTNHIVVFTDFQPGAVYRLKIESIDASNNAGESRDLTILTPQRKETVVDLIIKNFQDIFKWTDRIR